MKLSDKKIIEIMSKSPIRTFAGMLDTLNYLDGNWIQEEVEYELFNEALGDNPEEKVTIRVPNVGGITSNALLNFTWFAKEQFIIRRRERSVPSSALGDEKELLVFYEITPNGREFMNILEAIVKAREAGDE